MRSKMWQSGRKESARSPGRNDTRSQHDSQFDTMFECVSITPLGSPVVPEV